MSDTFGTAIIEETKRRLFDESFPRVRQCLSLLSDDEIWRRANPRCNSVGNLVLHVCGNARQWIGSGLAGHPDTRNRAAEFAEEGPMPRETLLGLLDGTESYLRAALDGVDPGGLTEKRPVQIYEESGISILVHVIEHVSYHTGQITYMVKAMKEVDTGYYAGQPLNERG